MFHSLKNTIVNWLMHDSTVKTLPICNFERISYELRPCDVILVEGRSRISSIIKTITQSTWSHSALYLGKIHDIKDLQDRELVRQHYAGSVEDPLIIESVLGKGTIISNLQSYAQDNIRVCRPQGISQKDANNVIQFIIAKLGTEYDIKQIIDLARLLLPWSIIPNKIRAQIFNNHAGDSTRTICSSMIAAAFIKVKYPILPEITRHNIKGIELQQRDPQLFTPKDFDYSPYFEIIKHPLIEFADQELYRNLPWGK